jgi:energy-coupling factor transporter ATP-binding protein EcfA2
MIDSIEISGIRGIARGAINGLTGISVLVGKNGCGKSTVLDCLELAVADSLVDAVRASLGRRGKDDDNLELAWWLRRPKSGSEIEKCLVKNQNGEVTTVAFGSSTLGKIPISRIFGATGETSALLVSGNHQNPQFETIKDGASRRRLFKETRFIDMRGTARPGESMVKKYSRCVSDNREDELNVLLRALVPKADSLRVLALPEPNSLHIKLAGGGTVPLSLGGDGVRNAVLLALELGVPKGSLVLIEEPETQLHPGAMALVAQAMALCAQNGSQVVLATHSLEFIDELIRATEGRDLLSVHGLSLDAAGLMKVSSFAPDIVKHARQSMGLDMR